MTFVNLPFIFSNIQASAACDTYLSLSQYMDDITELYEEIVVKW